MHPIHKGILNVCYVSGPLQGTRDHVTNKTQFLPSWKLHSNEYTCHLGVSIHNTYLFTIYLTNFY